MCDVYTAACTCYRNEQEYRDERARIDIMSRIEHEVSALLIDADADADAAPSSIAIRLADSIRAHPDGAGAVDLLAVDSGIFFWLADGAQCYAPLDRPAIRLAA